jgi:hypothetical protein
MTKRNTIPPNKRRKTQQQQQQQQPNQNSPPNKTRILPKIQDPVMNFPDEICSQWQENFARICKKKKKTDSLGFCSRL